MQKISKEIEEITLDYLKYVASRLFIDQDEAYGIGLAGKPILDLEFRQHGMDMYRYSVVLPLRNLQYCAENMDRRADVLDGLELVEPIYDHGCGVGMILLYLKSIGYTDLWGWDVPGVQATLAESYLAEQKINWGRPENPGTIICNNVLEHLPNPMEELERIRSWGGNLMANCTVEDRLFDIDHIAGGEERLRVVESLKKRGEWCDYGKEVILSWT